MALAQTMVKEVSMIATAFLSSFCPLWIANSGAPPFPNKFANAVMITIKGKHSPTAPSAAVPTSGILAI